MHDEYRCPHARGGWTIKRQRKEAKSRGRRRPLNPRKKRCKARAKPTPPTHHRGAFRLAHDPPRTIHAPAIPVRLPLRAARPSAQHRRRRARQRLRSACSSLSSMACVRNLLTGEEVTPLRAWYLNCEEGPGRAPTAASLQSATATASPRQNCGGRLFVQSVRDNRSGSPTLSKNSTHRPRGPRSIRDRD